MSFQSIALSLRYNITVMQENILSKNVKKIISEKGLQHRDVARLMGCDAASFSRMLSGNPRLDSILRIADALSVSPKTLFEEDFGIEGLVRYKGKTFFFNSRDEFESITRIPSQPKSTLSKGMIKKYKSVIFDLDNTLLDTSVLMPLVDKIQQSPSGTAGNKKLWKEHDAAIPQCNMYGGMLEVLNFIRDKGIKTAIVTNSVKRRIEACAKAFDLPVSKTCMIGRYSVKTRVPILKPDKRLFEKALEMMGTTADSVISFGNSVEDIQTAHNAGVESVACHWGATEKEWKEMLTANPTYKIETPSEIIPLLSKSC